MSRDEAIKMIKAKLECMTRDVSGRDDDCNNRRCGECPLNYEKGNMGEQKEWLRMAIEALEQQPSEEEKVIRIKKGTLKVRTGRYVIYDVEWLKEHFNTTEAKIYGQPKVEGARGDIPLQQSVPKMPQPSEDCVSREAVLSIIKSICFSEEYAQFRADYGSNGQRDAAIIYIKALPSVAPQPSEHTEERTETHECDLERIIKSTIKEYLDKDCDDVTELLLALNKDLCERIRKESENGL